MSQPNCGDYSTYQTNNSRSTGRVTVPPANVKVENVAGNAKFLDLSKNENATITNGIRKAICGEAGDSLQNLGNSTYKDTPSDIAKTSPILEAKDLSIRHQQSKEDHDQSSHSGKRVKHLRSSTKCLKATNVK
ncbi:HSF4 [Bugula neritina]|uniref:HSF4 n=1 Tax=Bugula neritina TaxID=10212 RepID=A0A7J7IW26_BUGNE|nr:HSF4 [Bugula neritina]